jgi:hypothetical protein
MFVFILTLLLVHSASALGHFPPDPVWTNASPPRDRLSDLLRDVETRANMEPDVVTVVQEMYDFLEWALDREVSQPNNSLFKCNNGESWLTFHSIFPWEPEKQFWVVRDKCQSLYDLVRSCPQLTNDDGIPPRERELIKAKCEGGQLRRFWERNFGSTTRNVTFTECLEFAGKWKALSLEGFFEHMERHGGPAYGGCLGHMVFDMIATKAINPLIPLPSLKSERGKCAVAGNRLQFQR